MSIAYTDVGEGPVVVFLHGIGSTRSVWDEQLKGLSDRFRCIALEYRGYGESQVPPAESLADGAADARAITRNAYARDTVAVLDAAGVGRAHLCGVSLGGIVALETYRHRRYRVASLLLCDTFAYYPGGAARMDDRLRMLEEEGMERFAQSASPGILKPSAELAHLERASRQMSSIPLEVYKASTRATWTGDYRSLLSDIEVPVLVVWGERDESIAPRALSQEIADLTLGCSGVTVIPEAGHVPNVDNPAAFNAAVTSFIEKNAK
ncbi:MAG: alpha/beta fold hydrolase [Candidatus Eremiobacteraeota bacterium]|nr:alpha/beta fold hydrolase [Candidatus Eremiobacteraeota bacterium]